MVDFASIKEFVENEYSKVSSKNEEILKDFWIASVSRECSVLARKDVLSGKGTFGITGDGKELAQIAMAKQFKKGDHRAGYYRDQTIMFALGLLSVEQFFAQLYADAVNDKFSGGRQMNNHFATPYIDKEGQWVKQTDTFNISSDTSCTAGQVGRGLGLALASKTYRSLNIDKKEMFSKNGNEVSFCTIGDASTSEGAFWETMNAAGVQQVPLAMCVWDDGFGISVPKEYQTTKGSVSKVLEGFKYDKKLKSGFRIHTAKGWDYEGLVEMFKNGIKEVRTKHIPALFHVEDCTQPLGHSTSGSHQRYKTKERLEFEVEMDCLNVMGEWIVEKGIASPEVVVEFRAQSKKYVRDARNLAWKAFNAPIHAALNELVGILNNITIQHQVDMSAIVQELIDLPHVHLMDVVASARKALHSLFKHGGTIKGDLENWISKYYDLADDRYHSHLYSEFEDTSALYVQSIKPIVKDDAEEIGAYQLLQRFFDIALDKYPELVAFGEDLGAIGGVNQGFAGLQKKYGKERVFDAGIREWTIVGQGIGMSMRGLRPIAEMQYLDYLAYAFSPLSDDLATVRYRSNGQQQAPLIIRTRGHRLEGIWHSGSPMGMLINSMKGIIVAVPRNMVQAIGFYNTLLQAKDPGIVIESLNGYRLREKVPVNLGEYTVPIGVPEVLQHGDDVTLVSYGSTLRPVQDAVNKLNEIGISVELIDARTILPFDINGMIGESLERTNKLVLVDEDFEGAATGFMLQSILDKQNGYRHLDAKPVTITGKDHRTPYGPDGDYFSKPNSEDVFDAVYKLMHEYNPDAYPLL